MKEAIAAGLWLAASVGLFLAGPSPDVLHVRNTSRVLIHVGKAGAFGFAGHAHEVEAPVTGSVTIDRADPGRSTVVLEFATASLRVTGKGEPAGDVAEVQRVMLSDRVLDAPRYPAILFQSRRIVGAAAGARGAFTVSVEGELSLHGVTKDVVVPVRVTLQDGSMDAEGTIKLKQTDFGIQPVTAAGGTVRVKDELEIEFTLHAGR